MEMSSDLGFGTTLCSLYSLASTREPDWANHVHDRLKGHCSSPMVDAIGWIEEVLHDALQSNGSTQSTKAK